MAQCKDCIHSGLCKIYSDFIRNHDCELFVGKAELVPKSEVEKLEKESSAFAEIIHKQEDEIQQLRKSLLTKQALEEEFSKSVKKIEKQALKTIEKAKQELAREIFEEIENAFHEDDFGDLVIDFMYFQELKKKYTEDNTNER